MAWKLGVEMAKPSVKQHLAAIRQLFDYLVTGGILPSNLAGAVRGPKYVVKRGKTPVLSADQARQLLDSIDVTELSGLRDRALIGVMVYSFVSEFRDFGNQAARELRTNSRNLLQNDGFGLTMCQRNLS